MYCLYLCFIPQNTDNGGIGVCLNRQWLASLIWHRMTNARVVRARTLKRGKRQSTDGNDDDSKPTKPSSAKKSAQKGAVLPKSKDSPPSTPKPSGRGGHATSDSAICTRVRSRTSSSKKKESECESDQSTDNSSDSQRSGSQTPNYETLSSGSEEEKKPQVKKPQVKQPKDEEEEEEKETMPLSSMSLTAAPFEQLTSPKDRLAKLGATVHKKREVLDLADEDDEEDDEEFKPKKRLKKPSSKSSSKSSSHKVSTVGASVQFFKPTAAKAPIVKEPIVKATAVVKAQPKNIEVMSRLNSVAKYDLESWNEFVTYLIDVSHTSNKCARRSSARQQMCTQRLTSHIHGVSDSFNVGHCRRQTSIRQDRWLRCHLLHR